MFFMMFQGFFKGYFHVFEVFCGLSLVGGYFFGGLFFWWFSGILRVFLCFMVVS